MLNRKLYMPFFDISCSSIKWIKLRTKWVFYKQVKKFLFFDWSNFFCLGSANAPKVNNKFLHCTLAKNITVSFQMVNSKNTPDPSYSFSVSINVLCWYSYITIHKLIQHIFLPMNCSLQNLSLPKRNMTMRKMMKTMMTMMMMKTCLVQMM